MLFSTFPGEPGKFRGCIARCYEFTYYSGTIKGPVTAVRYFLSNGEVVTPNALFTGWWAVVCPD